MLPRMRPYIMVSLVALAGLFLIGCESMKVEQPTDYEALQDASDAHLAYQRGDCESVARLANPRRLKLWESNEILYSMLLLNAYCKELDGDSEAAREIYDEIIVRAPGSYAARDATERSRIIRINENDPNFSSWMADARKRALGRQTTRVPIDRPAATFPPVARTTGIEGYAIVEFGVTPQGRTSDPIVVESKPPFLFDGASIRAVRRWEYMRKPSAPANDFQAIRLVFQNDDPRSPSGGVQQRGPAIDTESGPTSEVNPNP